MEKQNCVYILECADGTLYTGWTNDIIKRVAAHNLGLAAKYTRARLPVRLVYTEPCESKQLAMRREYQIKRLARSEKLALIGGCKKSKQTEIDKKAHPII